MHVLWRGSVSQRTRLVSGLVLFAFAATHFLNHALGLVGLRERAVATQTQIANTIRGYAAEFGLTAAKDLSAPEMRREVKRMHAAIKSDANAAKNSGSPETGSSPQPTTSAPGAVPYLKPRASSAASSFPVLKRLP